jgi:hypothetical protein
MAMSRGKTAKVRLGGGELFNTLYTSVLNWNTKTGRHLSPSRMYEVIGGGIGSVAAAGGWLLGGGLSIGLDRVAGLGVDQVLELEMVLPDGTHVKFGPTAWESTNPNYTYPQTTEVTGYCNTNVVTDESQWVWSACTVAVPWTDLWFAVRGGGGGTYGVVTAVHYQLHEFVNQDGFSFVQESVGIMMGSQMQYIMTVQELLINFFIDFMYNPTNVGTNTTVSNACGNTGFSLALTSGAAVPNLLCNHPYGSDALAAWQRNCEVIPSQYPDYYAAMQAATGNQTLAICQQAYALDTTVYSYVNQHIVNNDDNPHTTVSPVGYVPDLLGGGPEIYPNTMGTWNAAMPITWLQTKNADVHYWLGNTAGLHTQGGVSQHGDGMDAVPSSVRQAGYIGYVGGERLAGFNVNITRLRNAARPYIPAPSDGSYPPDTEYNHIAADTTGPLLSDWNTACPDGASEEYQAANCVPWETTVWGASVAARLLSIKQTLDPTNMFNCYRCIGYQSKN